MSKQNPTARPSSPQDPFGPLSDKSFQALLEMGERTYWPDPWLQQAPCKRCGEPGDYGWLPTEEARCSACAVAS